MLGFLEKVGDLRKGGDFDVELFLEKDAQFVDEVEVARISERDLEASVLRSQRDEIIAKHEVDRNVPEEVVINAGLFEIDVFAAVPRRE